MIKILTNNKRSYDIKSVYAVLKDGVQTGSKLTITAIYKGANQIWSLIKSCFGSGFWINKQTWSNTENWKN